MGDAMVGGWGYPADVRANTMCSVSTKTDIPLPLPLPLLLDPGDPGTTDDGARMEPPES